MENEKRLIDAKPLMKNGWHLVKTGKSNIFLASMSLADVPQVDAVEVVHGHKVVKERHRGVARYIPCPCCGSAIPSNKPYMEKVEYCSVCGKKLDDTFQNYCPNCCAKMDGGNEDV